MILPPAATSLSVAWQPGSNKWRSTLLWTKGQQVDQQSFGQIAATSEKSF